MYFSYNQKQLRQMYFSMFHLTADRSQANHSSFLWSDSIDQLLSTRTGAGGQLFSFESILNKKHSAGQTKGYTVDHIWPALRTFSPLHC